MTPVNQVAGTNGEPRNILNMPKTKKSALCLLSSIADHYRHSGKAKRQIFDSPKDAHDLVMKLHRKVAILWVRKAKTHRKHLQRVHRLKRRPRRTSYANLFLVYKKDTVDLLRAAVPKVFGQGALRRRVAVYPYRPMDTFLATHKVNVYKQGNRFDIVDALCNIPILAGLTRRALKEYVQW